MERWGASQSPYFSIFDCKVSHYRMRSCKKCTVIIVYNIMVTYLYIIIPLQKLIIIITTRSVLLVIWMPCSCCCHCIQIAWNQQVTNIYIILLNNKIYLRLNGPTSIATPSAVLLCTRVRVFLIIYLCVYNIIIVSIIFNFFTGDFVSDKLVCDYVRFYRRWPVVTKKKSIRYIICVYFSREIKKKSIVLLIIIFYPRPVIILWKNAFSSAVAFRKWYIILSTRTILDHSIARAIIIYIIYLYYLYIIVVDVHFSRAWTSSNRFQKNECDFSACGKKNGKQPASDSDIITGPNK